MRCNLAYRNAGIPRRRHGHGHGHGLAKHGYNLTRPREEIACVGRKIVAVFGESVSVSVSVSASWNARITHRVDVRYHGTVLCGAKRCAARQRNARIVTLPDDDRSMAIGLQSACTENLGKFGRAVYEIIYARIRTDKLTDK